MLNDQPPTMPPTGWASAAGLVSVKARQRPIGADEIVARLSIYDAFARWSVGLDEGNLELISSLFTDDADYVVSRPNGAVRTRQVGGARVAERIRELHGTQQDQRRHNIASVVIENLTADSAEAVAYGTVTRSADGFSLVGSVLYSASLRKGNDDIWRFARLQVGLDG